MPKHMITKVFAFENDLSFQINSKDNGSILFDMVCETLELKELWYFGLLYLDNHGLSSWLILDKPILDQDISKKSTLEFQFRVKYFPEDVAEELIQEKTHQYFYLQVKDLILSNDIYCPPEAAILLASYSVQAKYGDYDSKVYKPGFLRYERLIPDNVRKQFQMSQDMWEDRIVAWYSQRQGLLRNESELEYLKIAQDLEMYGITYFNIKNKKGTDLWLGVDALGLNIYEYNDKMSPKIAFPWNEIKNISFKDKKFTIKPIDKNSPDFTFLAQHVKFNKQILNICIGNHEQFMRKRNVDSLELQQMKMEAKKERSRKQIEKSRLSKEKEARMVVEKMKIQQEQELGNRAKVADLGKNIAHVFSRKVQNEKIKDSDEEPCENHVKVEKNDPVTQKNCFPGKEKQNMKSNLIPMGNISKGCFDPDPTQIQLIEGPLEHFSTPHIKKRKTQETLHTHLTNISFDFESKSCYSRDSGNDSPLSDEREKFFISRLQNDIKMDQEEYDVKSLYLCEQMKILREQIESLKVKENMSISDIKYEKKLEKGQTKYLTLNNVQQGTTKNRIAFFEDL